MHVLTARTKNPNVVAGTIDATKVGTGHRPHQTGSGTHDPKRNGRRMGTRNAQNRAAMRD